MQKKLLRKLNGYLKQNSRRRVRQRLLGTMACIVVFCTTYALILPAITLEKQCTIEEHTHSESCYVQLTKTQTRSIRCTAIAEGTVLLHTHGDLCRDETGALICPLEELEAHTHGDGCFTIPEDHTHGDECYTLTHVLSCGQEVTAGHSHTDDCYIQETGIACGLEESEDHSHSEDCNGPVSKLNCGLEETPAHDHTEQCYSETKTLNCQALTLSCPKAEYTEHTHTDSCYLEGTLVCELQQVIPHSHTDACVQEETVELDTETLTCLLEEGESHTHGTLCYGTWELICEKTEHTHTTACEPSSDLTEAQITQIDEVIALINRMPSADEINARLDEFIAAGDTEGEEAYYAEVSIQVMEVYTAYNMLPEEMKTYVTNADKLMELEYIWSAEVLATYTKDPTIYQINSYVYSWSAGATMAHGGTVGEALNVSWEFVKWIGVVVEQDGAGQFYVAQIADSGTNKNSLKANTANGFVLLFCDNFAEQPIVSVGDLVTVDASIPDQGALKYNSSTGVTSGGYGKVHFNSTINSISSDAPTRISSASTSEFIELNLFDYNGYINANFWNETNNYWYPGFQWNGGAYSNDSGDTDNNDFRYSYVYKGIGIPYAVTDRNRIDSIDFGNSLITNLTYGYGKNGDYTKSINATNVAKTSSNYSGNSPINWIYGNSTEGYTNKPIGSSTTDASYTDVMFDTLLKRNAAESGYPAMSDKTMLDYLFKDGSGGAVQKLNTQNIDGLFQLDPVSGMYFFNSRDNHAEYVFGENRFQLYADIITPNFLAYPFGNFLPLNTIEDSGKVTQVSAFNYSGGMRDYVDRIIADLGNNAEGLDAYWSDTQQHLAAMLEEYKENWLMYPRSIGGISNSWTNLSPANAIRDYFLGDTDGGGDKPSSDVGFITADHLSRMYNIDWDVQTNFFFGMEMKMSFYQPKDGMTGNDHGNNANPIDTSTNKRAGSPDGIPDYPMEFYFTGDDDVWVYIDGVLFLDLSGIHRHVGGKIDFVNGTVSYYALVPAGGDVSTTAYKTFTFKEILDAAGQSTAGLNSKGTFENYSNHTFNFYYLERGSGSSICRMSFNFPLLRQNTLSVEKELTADADIKALGNPDFQFQVLDVDENGNKTNDSFFDKYDSAGDQWAYSLYDRDGSVIQKVKVTEKNPDGTVKTLEVYDANGTLVRKETEDAKGNHVITNYGDVLTIDENGIFTLKAGQRAEFIGISENWGKYYVRELMDPAIVAQYGNITVDGNASSHVGNITVGNQTFQGYDSPVLDMSNGSTRFLFNNKITYAKLGNLSIRKILDAAYSGDTDKTFRFRVTLDGEPLPEGTTYTVGSATKTVEVDKDASGAVTASYVVLDPGETAVISKILAGTDFQVVETTASAEGYAVSYTVDGAAQQTSASGTIGLNQTVAVVVTNSEQGTSVKIPVSKGYYKYGTVDRVSHFKLTPVTDATGMTACGEPLTASMTVSTEAVTNDALFELGYVENGVDFGDSDTLVFYYRLTEDNTRLPGSTLPNYQVFVYEVTLTKTDADISADITGMWCGTADVNGIPTGALTKLDNVTTAGFMNTIYGPLTVSKKADGSDVFMQRDFEFQIILNTTHHGGAPLPETLPATITRAAEDGTVTTEDTMVTLVPLEGEMRKSCTVMLSHNETITINQIPYHTTWSVTEQNVPETVDVSYEIYKGTELVDSVSEGKPVGYVLVGGANVAKVVCTNVQNYVLPETGGAGTISYTLVGLMLICFSMACLMYRPSKRRREVS